MNTVVQYSYISKKNKKWLAELGLEYDQPVSTIIEEILNATRDKRRPKFVKRVRAAVARLAKSKTKKRAKIKELNKPAKKAKKATKKVAKKAKKTTKKGVKNAGNNATAKAKTKAKTKTETQRLQP